jgi:hypothetical protein
MRIVKNPWAQGVIYATPALVTAIGLVNMVSGAVERAARIDRQSSGAMRQERASPEKRFNWAAPRLLPVDVELRAHRVALKTGSEQVVLDGREVVALVQIFDVQILHGCFSKLPTRGSFKETLGCERASSKEPYRTQSDLAVTNHTVPYRRFTQGSPRLREGFVEGTAPDLT